MSIQILLAIDAPLERPALRSILESEPDLTIAGEGSDGADVRVQESLAAAEKDEQLREIYIAQASAEFFEATFEAWQEIYWY